MALEFDIHISPPTEGQVLVETFTLDLCRGKIIAGIISIISLAVMLAAVNILTKGNPTSSITEIDELTRLINTSLTLYVFFRLYSCFFQLKKIKKRLISLRPLTLEHSPKELIEIDIMASQSKDVEKYIAGVERHLVWAEYEMLKSYIKKVSCSEKNNNSKKRKLKL